MADSSSTANGSGNEAKVDYDVGYKKPPLATRFKKGGPSPNPSGRPKGRKTFFEYLDAELSRLMEFPEKGRTQKMPLARLIAKRVAKDAFDGDRHAIQRVVDNELRRMAQAEAEANAEVVEILEFTLQLEPNGLGPELSRRIEPRGLE